MAIVVEDECKHCDSDGYPCLGADCPNMNVKRYYCDGEDCGEEFHPKELYDYDGTMLCKDCLAKQFKTIEEKEN